MTEVSKTFVFRADASPEIGLGHFMRTFALAQECKRSQHKAVFALSRKDSDLERRLSDAGISVHNLASPKLGSPQDAESLLLLAESCKANGIVIDGYHFQAHYQNILKKSGIPTLLIDDCGGSNAFHVDLLLNQNLYASLDLYPNRDPKTKFLLGSKYTLLREEFLKRKLINKPVSKQATKILITLGGGTSLDLVHAILQPLQKMAEYSFEVKFIIGSQSKIQIEALNSIQQSSTSVKVSFVQNPQNLPELMEWAELAISAAGSTCYELAYLGIPLLVIPIANNQRPIAESLASLGIAENLGWFENLEASTIQHSLASLMGSPSRRELMSRKARELIDGLGTQRVLLELTK